MPVVRVLGPGNPGTTRAGNFHSSMTIDFVVPADKNPGARLAQEGTYKEVDMLIPTILALMVLVTLLLSLTEPPTEEERRPD